MAKTIRGITNMTKLNSQEEDGIANFSVRILVAMDINNWFIIGFVYWNTDDGTTFKINSNF
jgi:hypothetical protein